MAKKFGLYIVTLLFLFVEYYFFKNLSQTFFFLVIYAIPVLVPLLVIKYFKIEDFKERQTEYLIMFLTLALFLNIYGASIELGLSFSSKVFIPVYVIPSVLYLILAFATYQSSGKSQKEVNGISLIIFLYSIVIAFMIFFGFLIGALTVYSV